MRRRLLMGIDIGTQSTRAALLTPQAGWAEQDLGMWWSNALNI